MAIVYLLYSKSANKFYTGFTSLPLDERFERHQSHYYDNKFTARYDDWEIFLSITCTSITQAQKLEKHIKEMKSSQYIRNLKLYPEILDKLMKRYVDS